MKVLSANAKLVIIVVGLVLILIGNGFKYELLKIDIDSMIVNIGALLLVIGTLQWIFDEGVRKEIVQEISMATLGTERIYQNGIVDCLDDSKKINDENIWKSTSELIIGVHYSNRFLKDYAEIIKYRINHSKYTYILHLEDQSDAANYLRNSRSGDSSIGEKTRQMNNLIELEFQSSPLIKIIKHNRVLRYSFIKTDQSIWIRFFTNSKGYSLVPAIKIGVGTPLFLFFENDIKKINEDENHEV